MDLLVTVMYYVIQIEEHYYQHTDGIVAFTEDEEQAYAFTNLADAKQKAIEVEGVVRKREVSYKELQELSEQHEEEYMRLPSADRESIEILCKYIVDIKGDEGESEN